MGIYNSILRKYFAPKVGSDGNYFTAIHAALLRLPFRGYVTTNFDESLLEARLRLRTELRYTGCATWKDEATVARWNSDDIFTEQPCPILFAHGVWDRPDTIVLGAAEYRDAYREGASRRLLSHLWITKRLVFTGFSFSDDWIKFVANEVLMVTANRTTEPRHFALIGLPSDQTYAPFMRKLYANQYDAEAVFYPVVQTPGNPDDHSALLEILIAISDGVAAGVVAVPSGSLPEVLPSPHPATTPLTVLRWVHETTNDDRYTGRGATMERLDRWVADPSVRVISVTGIGGLGKTSLIGHWLKRMNGARGRPFAGQFFWSFYADREVANFVKEFVAFMTGTLGVCVPPEHMNPGMRALAMLKAKEVLLVLDGLELLQTSPDQSGFSAFLSPEVTDLLDGACRQAAESLVIMTSRFRASDLYPYLGDTFRALDLSSLSPSEGAELLRASGVNGSVADRETVSRRFEGHALALRVFALTIEQKAKGDPTRLIELVFDAAHADEIGTFEGKLSHLLLFYERRLQPERLALLELVSLFHAPALETVILTLAHGSDFLTKAVGSQTDSSLRKILEKMRHENLLIRDMTSDNARVWSCHPVLRDYFRKRFLERGLSAPASAARLITTHLPKDHPNTFQELLLVLTCVELLVEARDFHKADQMYRARLGNGTLLKNWPAPIEGRRCALMFVGNAETRNAYMAALDVTRVAFMLNEVSLFAQATAEFEEASHFGAQSIALYRQCGSQRAVSTLLRNEAGLQYALGQLGKSETAARDALAAARLAEGGRPRSMSYSLCFIANALTAQGSTNEAFAAFSSANTIERAIHPEGVGLHSVRGLQWARLLLRLGKIEDAQAITEQNLRVCEQDGWHTDVARCHTLLAILATQSGRFQDAAQGLSEAEPVFRRASQIADLADLSLARAELHRCQGHWNDALANVTGALRLAAPRKMMLIQADALIVRGRIYLGDACADGQPLRQQQIERAGDDLDQALSLARSHNYAWVERDALVYLGEIQAQLGNKPRSAALVQEAEALAQRLFKISGPAPNF